MTQTIKRACLFCKCPDGPFTNKEHVFPESLGNTTIVLAPGAVCDSCNNYFHSIEERFIATYPGVLMKHVMVNRTKQRKGPFTQLPGGSSFRTPRDSKTVELKLIVEPEEDLVQLDELRASTRGPWHFPPIRLPTENRTNTSRFLAKVSLELLYIQNGLKTLHPAFDALRDFARKAKVREYVPYAWRQDIAQPYIWRTLGIGKEGEPLKAILAHFSVPGCQYLYPIIPLHNSIQYIREVAEALKMRLEEQGGKAKPINLNITIERGQS